MFACVFQNVYNTIFQDNFNFDHKMYAILILPQMCFIKITPQKFEVVNTYTFIT